MHNFLTSTRGLDSDLSQMIKWQLCIMTVCNIRRLPFVAIPAIIEDVFWMRDLKTLVHNNFSPGGFSAIPSFCCGPSQAHYLFVVFFPLRFYFATPSVCPAFFKSVCPFVAPSASTSPLALSI